MNIFMFSSFVCDKSVKKIVKKLPHESIGYIPANYLAEACFYDARSYTKLGFKTGVVFPLGRNYNKKLERVLFSCDAIHIGGGNTFELLFMLRARGMIEKLKEYVSKGGILFGTSAGSIVMCPDISIARFADENWLNLSGDSLNGLGLVDFYMKPHYETWANRKHLFQNFAKETGRRVYCLREFQGIYVNDDGVKFLNGPPKRFVP